MQSILRTAKSTTPAELKSAIMAELQKNGIAVVDAIGANCTHILSKAYIMARGHAMCFGNDLSSKLSFVNLRMDNDPSQVKTGIRWTITIEKNEGDSKAFMEAL
ncbi:stage V sporulation protein S [Dethiobacter alkaliphilus]|uniref:stage V sporulation protein S n=1 Tax=Dethiobacter alkaliphilus TaxID=427926 RepID=UPI0022274EE9|nr:stage V sporulation protein S [Dethiobacter alkaliphilus]MCW3491523.1 stage V sporulation protein S [Dethiobacter alkaliphilus]